VTWRSWSQWTVDRRPCYHGVTQSSIIKPARCCKHPPAWHTDVGGPHAPPLYPHTHSAGPLCRGLRVCPAPLQPEPSSAGPTKRSRAGSAAWSSTWSPRASASIVRGAARGTPRIALSRSPRTVGHVSAPVAAAHGRSRRRAHGAPTALLLVPEARRRRRSASCVSRAVAHSVTVADTLGYAGIARASACTPIRP
jgi:hypothetical protein